MDDAAFQISYPIWIFVTGGIQVGACVLVLVACLVLVRRGAAAVAGVIGGLLAGSANGLYLADSIRVTHGADDYWLTDDLIEPVAYAQSVGYALIAIALVLALLRPRKPVE